MNTSTLVQKLWNYCNVLRDDGMSYGDYVEDLDEFVKLYNPANPFDRAPTWSADNADGRWRCHEADELMARDKGSLDIFWLRDETLADSDNLPPPEVIAQEIVDDLEAALEQFRLIASDLAGSMNEQP